MLCQIDALGWGGDSPLFHSNNQGWCPILSIPTCMHLNVPTISSLSLSLSLSPYVHA